MNNKLMLALIHAIAEKSKKDDTGFTIEPEKTGGEIVSYSVIEVTERTHPATHKPITELVFDDMGQDEAQLCADLMNLGIGVYPDEIRFEVELLPFIHALIED